MVSPPLFILVYPQSALALPQYFIFEGIISPQAAPALTLGCSHCLGYSSINPGIFLSASRASEGVLVPPPLEITGIFATAINENGIGQEEEIHPAIIPPRISNKCSHRAAANTSWEQSGGDGRKSLRAGTERPFYEIIWQLTRPHIHFQLECHLFKNTYLNEIKKPFKNIFAGYFWRPATAAFISRLVLNWASAGRN